MNASEFRKKAVQIINKYNIKNDRFLESQISEKIWNINAVIKNKTWEY